MDDFLNAVHFNKPFSLSWEEGDTLNVTISSDVLKFCSKPDMHALDFLYGRYRRGLKGVILNPEEDINSHLQVSTLLGSLHKALNSKFVVLVLCPDNAVVKWHYYMTWCGMFDIKILTENLIPDEIDEYKGTILIVTFSNIKLIESLLYINLFSVIIDKFEEVATKLIVRKLQGNFNIGVTFRNFYTNPDQKLQWSMLNWANPGCVGKLADFYEIDNENFVNFRDQYKEWWFRLTWTYCDSFVRPSLTEKFELSKKLKGWAEEHNLLKYTLGITKKKASKKTKTKKELKEQGDSKNNNGEIEAKRSKKVYNKNTKEKSIKNIIFNNANNIEKSDSDDSNATIIYREQNELDLKEDIQENHSEASERDIFVSLASSEEPTLENHKKDSPKQSDIEDESELFLKSFATPYDEREIETEYNKNYINSILKGKPVADVIENIALKIEKEKVDDILPVSDIFKNILGENEKTEQVENSVEPLSDVDILIAEAMEMVRE